MQQAIRILLLMIIIGSFSPVASFAQQSDRLIIHYVQSVSKGHSDEIATQLPAIEKTLPRSAGLLYIEGLVATNGDAAIHLFHTVADSFPTSDWADDALMRLAEYYSNVGSRQSADDMIHRLTSAYPRSPYITTRYIDGIQNVQDDTSSRPITTTEGVEYAIQVGAFAIKENAERFQKQFIAEGYITMVYENFLDGKNLLYLVWIGSYPTREAAELQMKEVNLRHKIKTILRTRSKWKKW